MRNYRWTIGPCFVAILSIFGCADRRSPAPKSDRELLVERIISGQIQPDDSGTVELTDNKELSIGGKVYVTKLVKGVAILFADWRGKGRNMRGELFISDTQKRNVGSIISVNSFDVSSTIGESGTRLPTVRVVDLTIQAQLRPKWYRVEFSMD
ncbi:hypothetical protein ACFL2H_11955 [Planctomycetota bacterium]